MARDANDFALNAAARAIAKIARAVAVKHSRKSADAVNVTRTTRGLSVKFGSQGGRWGWTPIEALMFDDNKRHPLFGDRDYWYNQNEHHGNEVGLLTQGTIDAGAAQAAADAYAEAFVQAVMNS